MFKNVTKFCLDSFPVPSFSRREFTGYSHLFLVFSRPFLWNRTRATPHKCHNPHYTIGAKYKLWITSEFFVRKGALTQAARQGLSARIRFANANMILNLACCFSSPRYRVFRKRSCFLTTPNTCSTFARTEDFARSAFFAAYCPLLLSFFI